MNTNIRFINRAKFLLGNNVFIIDKECRAIRLPLLLLCSVFLILIRWSACKDLNQLWNSSEEFNSLWVAVPISVIPIWQRRDLFISFKWQTSCVPIAAVIAIIICQILGIPSGTRVQILVLIVSIGLLIWVFLGWTTFKHTLIPLMISVFTIPLPQWLWDEITLILQFCSWYVFTSIYGLVGPVITDGFAIFLCNSKTGAIVAEQCSGIRSIFGLLIIGSTIIPYLQTTLAKKLFLFLSIPVIAFTLNIIRIFLSVTLIEIGLRAYATGFWHGLAGIAVFVVDFVILVKLCKLIARPTAESHSKP